MNDFIKTLDNGSKLCRSCYRTGKTDDGIQHNQGCYYAAWQAHKAGMGSVRNASRT